MGFKLLASETMGGVTGILSLDPSRIAEPKSSCTVLHLITLSMYILIVYVTFAEGHVNRTWLDLLLSVNCISRRTFLSKSEVKVKLNTLQCNGLAVCRLRDSTSVRFTCC